MKNKDFDWTDIKIKLRRAYDLALSQTADNFTFFINLINYVAIFDEIPELVLFQKEYIVKQSEDDHKNLKKLEAKLEKETLRIFDIVKPYVENY